MSELFTEEEVQQYMRDEVADAGGPKKWLRKNKISGESPLHMIQNGQAATLSNCLAALGFRKVTRYEPLKQ